MAEPADINVDELRRRARRRLVGAVVLALGVAVVVPMLLETEQKPLGEDVSVKIPPVDNGKFVNRLNDGTAPPAAGAATPATDATNGAPSPAANDVPSARTPKYDTRVPDAAAGASPPASEGTAPPPAPSSSAPPATAAETSAPVQQANTTQPAATGSARSAEPAAKDAGESLQAAHDSAKASHPAHSVVRAPEATKAVHENAAPREGYAVQLAAFADDRGANSLAGRLKKAGYAAYTEPLKTSKGTLWRVRVGPYSSREAALAARDKLKTEGQIGIVAAIK